MNSNQLLLLLQLTPLVSLIVECWNTLLLRTGRKNQLRFLVQNFSHFLSSFSRKTPKQIQHSTKFHWKIHEKIHVFLDIFRVKIHMENCVYFFRDLSPGFIQFGRHFEIK